MRSRELLTALRLTLLLMLVGGVGYPALLYGLAHAVFPRQAETSLVRDRCGVIVGSALIGQRFTGAQWFHGRPSANNYDAGNSGGTNLGPTSTTLAESLLVRATRFRRENGLDPAYPLPADAITTSGSGLDPDVSLETAQLQVARVAAAHLGRDGGTADSTRLHALVRTRSAIAWPGSAARRVNVLSLNLALDSLSMGDSSCPRRR